MLGIPFIQLLGAGSLTKAGDGTLELVGDNSYSGGTRIQAGTLTGAAASAFGKGDLVNTGGTLAEHTQGVWTIGGGFTQSENGTLNLNLDGPEDVLDVKGQVQLGGKLLVDVSDGYKPGTGSLASLRHEENRRSGQFSSVEVKGISGTYTTRVQYLAGTKAQ